jgi:hypothetical protein
MSRPWMSQPWTPTPFRQRLITETLAKTRSFFLDDLLPARHAADELDKFTAAADELAARGEIRILRALGLSGSTVTIIYRCNEGTPDPLTIARLSGGRRV